MQTFLPIASLVGSLRVLDNKRLGKQRVETYQIIKALTLENYGWKNHPAVKMWKGSEYTLAEYGLISCEVWTARGFNDSLRTVFDEYMTKFRDGRMSLNYPKWFGDDRLHSSHRSNLLRKDPVHYGAYDWPERSDMEYFWPTKHPDYMNRIDRDLYEIL